MKNLMKLAFALILMGLLFTGCVTNSKSMPGVDLPLAEADYEILGDTQAEFTLVQLLGIPMGDGQNNTGSISGYSGALGSIGTLFDPTGIAKSAALYKALEQMPEADMVIEPRYEIESTSFLGIYRSTTVQVKAKAIKLIEGKQIAND